MPEILTRAELERFEAKIDRSPGLGPNGDCHEWTGSRRSDGYGKLTIRRGGRRRWPLAHRVAWALGAGRWPGKLSVLHSCDNPPCVRFDHLWLGTQADNMADCSARGRAPVGERHSSAKVTNAQVDEIRALRGSRSQSAIGRVYGLSRQYVGAIQRGQVRP